MVVNGSLSKTAVNGSAGAHSQTSGPVVAALTVVTLLFLTSLFETLPEATLAAVVIAAVVELVDISALRGSYALYSRRLGRIYGRAGARPDFIAAVAAMVGVLIFDTLPGLVLGVIVSLVLLIYRTSKPHVAEVGRVPGTGQFGDVDRSPGNEVDPAVPVLRVEGGLFFANADAVRRAIKQHAAPPGVAGVVLDAEAIPSVDVTAVRMLDEVAHARNGQRLVIAPDLGQVGDLLDDASTELGVVRTIDEALADLGGQGTP
jgi:MFS superfamily sulfate permease-like transporter